MSQHVLLFKKQHLFGENHTPPMRNGMAPIPNIWDLGIAGNQGPHSQGSLKEIPKFLQNFRPQNNILKSIFN